MLEPEHLTMVWAFTACNRDRFTFFTNSKIIVLSRSTAMFLPLLSALSPNHIPHLPPLLLHSASYCTSPVDHSFLNHSLFSSGQVKVYFAVNISLYNLKSEIIIRCMGSLVLLCYSGCYNCCSSTFISLHIFYCLSFIK
jgi:hypothetical protein